MIDEVCQILRTCRLRFSDEKQLQAGLERVLQERGFVTAREQDLGDGVGVIDFLVLGRKGEEPLPVPLGIEVKIKGTSSEVGRQLYRYAMSPKIAGLILATSLMRHTRDLSVEGMADKPYRAVMLVGSAF